MKSYNPVAVMLILINHLDNKTLLLLLLFFLDKIFI